MHEHPGDAVILTVTLDTALDVTYRVPRLTPHAPHRVREVTTRPGGKGINVARVLAALGHDTVALGFAGGRSGAELRSLIGGLDLDGRLTDALVEVSGETRRTLAVVDDASGDTTRLDEPGPHVRAEEWGELLARYGELLPGADAVALCGGLPPGVPVGAYATLVRAARAAGVPVLLDAGGEPLRRGLAARPDLVKPNLAELSGLTGAADPLHAAREARRRGAGAVAASLGADGMVAVTAGDAWRAAPPRRVDGNPSGAGDSAVAALLAGVVEGLPWPERLARAVALSAATVGAPVAGEFDAGTYERLLPRVRVTTAA